LGPDEIISIYDALKAITIKEAGQVSEEESIGGIKKGKSAELVWLSENPLKSKEFELKNIKVMSTWIEGEKVNTSPYTWQNFKLAIIIIIDYLKMKMAGWFNMEGHSWSIKRNANETIDRNDK
jgi:Predicted metal-dependent hydrolase with the TIM-barrel fold